MRYLDEFMGLRCSGDVLNIVSPLGNKATKEITESMAVIKYLKRITLKKPMEYNVLDLCAGNALTSVLSAFMLPVSYAIAIDKNPRSRPWHLAKRFHYFQRDIHEDSILHDVNDKTIVISVHPCSSLADRVIELYQKSKAPHLIMMPCCHGNFPKHPFLVEKLGKYACWCLHLSQQVRGTLSEDPHCMSPKNMLIKASKEITNG